MTTNFPTSKYKIILLLSIFVFLIIFFVYSSVDYDKLNSKYNNYKNNDDIIKIFNKSVLEAALINFNYTSRIVDDSLKTTKTVDIKNIRIFCMILTTPKNFEMKTTIVNRTWAKDCDKYFFVTKMSDNLPFNQSYEYEKPFPILQPALHSVETYGKLTDKVYKTLRDVYLRYNDYDWYLKADDDTFIFVDNLKSFLNNKNSSKPVTFGFDFQVIVDKGYHSGGAGYVLSNEALKRIGTKLVSDFKYCPNSGVEDVDVAKCLRKLSVYPEKSIDEKGRERFHPFDVGTHIMGGYPDWYYQYAANPVKKGIDGCSETSISFHYMSPEQIEKLYMLWNSFKKSETPFNATTIFYQMLI